MKGIALEEGGGVVVVASSPYRSILEKKFPLYSHVSHYVRACMCMCVNERERETERERE